MTTANTTTLGVALRDQAQATAERLVELATRGLPPMFDRETGLFCFKLNGSGGGLVRDGQSPRYTAITLLGLHRLEKTGVRSPIEIAPVLDNLLWNTDWVDNIGDLGLLLWLCAQASPDRLEEVDKQLGVRRALQEYSDARRGQTMELAWLLTGLCYWGLACPEKLPGLERLASEVFGRLKNNQGRHGIFGHAAGNGSLAGRARGWIGSFADQVYPIYAMALLAKSYATPEAKARALQCGRAICDAQGDKGQWWWHYDSSTGQVIDGYPVFSVHQHAMGPMALFTLGEVAGHDFSPWIYRGLEWINGRNELQFDMENSTAKVVWRCIFQSPPQFKKYLNAAFDRESPASIESRNNLKVLFECRPYELGWLLYAFAGRIARPGSACNLPEIG